MYYTPLDVVVKKGKFKPTYTPEIQFYFPEGILEWYQPNSVHPLLSCNDPRLANVKFIGFSSHNLNPNRYIIDCPPH